MKSLNTNPINKCNRSNLIRIFFLLNLLAFVPDVYCNDRLIIGYDPIGSNISFESKKLVPKNGKLFIKEFSSGNIEQATNVFWRKDASMKEKIIADYNKNMKPVLPKIGARIKGHFAGAVVISENVLRAWLH